MSVPEKHSPDLSQFLDKIEVDEWGVLMPYEIWSSEEWQGRPRGWYRGPSGHLYYWDGSDWAGSPSPLPEHLPVRSRPTRAAGTGGSPNWALVAIGWIAAITFLGLLLSDVSVVDIDCGTLFSPRATSGDQANAFCARAFHTRAENACLMALVSLFAFAAGSRAAQRFVGSRWLRNTPATA